MKDPATRALPWAEIEEVFKSWQQQAATDEKLLQLWNCLLADLRMKAEHK